ncbi:MAG: hypothetical protein RSB55_01225 [Oscillospiraceae bacterium]
MTVNLDFSLGFRFGVVEQTIFRLVLNGVTSSRQISELLWVFSDAVLANAIKELVNHQVISADLASQRLSLSDAVVAIIETCLANSYELNMPESLVDRMPDGRLLVTDTKTKEAILAQLLPDTKLGFLAKALDFTLCKRGELDGQ